VSAAGRACCGMFEFLLSRLEGVVLGRDAPVPAVNVEFRCFAIGPFLSPDLAGVFSTGWELLTVSLEQRAAAWLNV